MPKPYTPNDKWSQRAAREGYRARSVYKLMELDVKFRLLKRGMTVLDLGAAPGSWLQYEAEKVGPEGLVIGLDLQEIKEVGDNVKTAQVDITDEEKVRDALKKFGAERVDLLVSDLAPSTSGIRDVDQWKSVELSEAVLRTADTFLKSKGKCVIKVLRGADFDEFLRQTKEQWVNVRTAQVAASRDRSKEIYVVAQKP
jgi:23S rRNA (uridine2552-2'-O)-methyltransferase